MRTTVMEGSFGEFDLASVIQVVSLGRQYTGVELFDESGNVVGTLHLKSGKILAARSGATTGLDAVSSLLRGNRHRRFYVYRDDPVDDAVRPIGSIGEVLLGLLDKAPESSEQTPVLEGSFAEFDLFSVLQVISIGRQFTLVRVTDSRGRVLGQIELKAGKVLSAASGQLHGLDAIRRLARSPRDARFVVLRARTAAAEHHLGPLAQILLKLAEPDGPTADDGWGTEPGTAAAPVAPAPPPTVPRVDARPERPAVRAGSVRPPPVPSPSRPPPPVVPDLATRSVAAKPVRSAVPVVAVSSPKGGAGKTTVALNLAVGLTHHGKRVIVVDSDANGVLLALNRVDPAGPGAYDLLGGKAKVGDALIQTRIPGLRILPSGESTPQGTSVEAWRALFDDVRVAAVDVVLVDTAAGLLGSAGDACAAATHNLVVLAAEPAAIRALPGHLRRLATLGRTPPTVVGIVLNMLDYRARVSLDVLGELCGGPSGPWVFDIPIARSTAFMEAVARGVPVCRGERTDTTTMPTIGWVFEMLASGVLERLGLLQPAFDEDLLV